MNRGRELFGVCLLAAACVLVSSSAYAASGTVTGSWRLFNNLGNYCDVPSGTAGDQNGTGNQTCNSATRYPESQYRTYQPIAYSKLYLKACSNTDVSSCTTVYGQNSTDANGSFSIPWSASITPPYFRIFWQLENKDDRFRVRGSGGGTLAYWTPAITAISGTQFTGTWSVGSSTSPSDIANIYYGAHRMWYDALSYSTRMVNDFTGLEIRTNNTECPSACASGSSNLIKMPSGAEYSPQARILHEMGHIASYKSNPRRLTHGQYCYPNTTGSCGWTQTTSEWRGVAQEEGFATFLGDVALYWFWHTDPRTCLSSDTCDSGSSIESVITCSGTVGRQALQVDRYMWDIYDSVNDGESVNASYFAFFDTWGAVPDGYSWGQDESPFVSSGSSVDAWDSFHPWEWHNAMLNQYSGAIETQTPYFNNCMGWF